MTYEYECQKCKRTFEVEQRITDAPLTRHPEVFIDFEGVLCDGELKRLVSAPAAFVLKGKGWAKDGYR